MGTISGTISVSGTIRVLFVGNNQCQFFLLWEQSVSVLFVEREKELTPIFLLNGKKWEQSGEQSVSVLFVEREKELTPIFLFSFVC